ncbi:MAG TPA: hypothetical protein VFN23_00335 [Ktedonobacteraceae bacterium]|nr:hypothetical protein [Ktedonobacteraceae bacterium]
MTQKNGSRPTFNEQTQEEQVVLLTGEVQYREQRDEVTILMEENWKMAGFTKKSVQRRDYAMQNGTLYPSNLEITARHEAGHAVVAKLFTWSVEEMVLYADPADN